MTHPNALAALITTGIAAGILYLAHRLGYAHLTSEQAVTAAGGLVTVVLFVGKRGIRPLLSQVWNGSQAAVGVKKPKA